VTATASSWQWSPASFSRLTLACGFALAISLKVYRLSGHRHGDGGEYGSSATYVIGKPGQNICVMRFQWFFDFRLLCGAVVAAQVYSLRSWSGAMRRSSSASANYLCSGCVKHPGSGD